MPLIAVTLGMVVSATTIEQWLDEISLRESNNRDDAVGDAGEISAWQIMPDIWRAYVLRIRACGKRHRHPLLPCVSCPDCSRKVARAILLDCIDACVKHKRPVTFDNVYWFYQHGGF